MWLYDNLEKTKIELLSIFCNICLLYLRFQSVFSSLQVLHCMKNSVRSVKYLKFISALVFKILYLMWTSALHLLWMQIQSLTSEMMLSCGILTLFMDTQTHNSSVGIIHRWYCVNNEQCDSFCMNLQTWWIMQPAAGLLDVAQSLPFYSLNKLWFCHHALFCSSWTFPSLFCCHWFYLSKSLFSYSSGFYSSFFPPRPLSFSISLCRIIQSNFFTLFRPWMSDYLIHE